MKNIEDEYNERFKNQEMLNDDFDAEGLWADISEELDKDTPKAYGFFKRNGSILILLLLLSTGIAYFISSSPEQNVPLVKKEIISEQNDKNRPEHSIAHLKSDKTKAKKTDVTKNKANSTMPINTPSKKPTSKVSDVNKNTIINKQKSLISSTKNTFANTSNIGTDTASKNTDAITSKNTASSTPNKTITKTTNQENKQLLPPTQTNNTLDLYELEIEKEQAPLALLEVKKADLPLAKQAINAELFSLKNNKKVKKNEKEKSKLHIGISAYGGGNYSSFSFKSLTNDTQIGATKNDTESGIIGNTTGIGFSVFQKEWELNSGAELNTLHTLFDYTQSQNTQVQKNQALVGIYLDSTATEVLREVRRDTFVNASQIRAIKHYNSYQVLSIPLEIGYFKSNSKWRYGISAGLNFDFLLKQEGKNFDATGAISTFDKNSTSSLYNKFSIGLRTRGFVGYYINPRTSLFLSPQWSLSRQKIYNKTLSVQLHRLHLNAGIRIDW